MARIARMVLMLALALPLAAPAAAAVATTPPAGAPYRTSLPYQGDLFCVDMGPPVGAQVLQDCASFYLWLSTREVGVRACVPFLRLPVRDGELCVFFKERLTDE